jgi:hypothetical protein
VIDRAERNELGTDAGAEAFDFMGQEHRDIARDQLVHAAQLIAEADLGRGVGKFLLIGHHHVLEEHGPPRIARADGNTAFAALALLGNGAQHVVMKAPHQPGVFV